MKHLAILALIAATAASHLFAAGEITLRTCEGCVKSDFDSLGLDIDWNVEWPETIDGVGEKVLTAIHRRICLDVFTEPFYDRDSKKPPMHYDRPDQAQRYLVYRALFKIREQADRYLDYHAKLKICLATSGYLGYTIIGCHSEGGNGCHDYSISRVFSLNTGKLISEHDLFDPENYDPLNRHIVAKAVKEKNTSTMPEEVSAYRDVMSRGLFDDGNFMIEPGGIRWHIPPYSVFCGADGVVDTLVPWDDLKPFFRDPGYCDALKNIAATARTVIRE
ncbi:MAG: RsiV family protein [Kiritimatiellia bacterium]|jgi:hypothetical protein|nr:RsiV family protein [Kiritimatiellia bacterium]